MSIRVAQILEAVRSLSSAEKVELLNAVEAEVLSGPPEAREEFIRSASGMFPHIPFSTADLVAEKAEESEC